MSGKPKNGDMRHISELPYGDGGYQFTKGGVNKFFSVGQYGSKRRALAACKAYRDEVLANLEVTPVLGVFHVKGGDANTFVAKYVDKGGTFRSVTFPASLHGGEHAARDLAIVQFTALNGA